MHQKDSTASSQLELRSQTNMIENTQKYPDNTRHESTNTFFSVTEQVTFKPTPAIPERRAWPLPPTVARLVSLVGLSTACLLPLSACGSAESMVPCPIPTPNPARLSAPNDNSTPTASCRTSNGTHYVWIRNRGGWVASNDGIHPKQGATGIGVNDEESRGGTGKGKSSSGTGEEGRGGVGDGHSGSGHGGGEGG